MVLSADFVPKTEPQNSSANGFSTRRGRRVLICVRGQCAESGRRRQLEQRLNELIQQHGLDDSDHPQHTCCTITNCLDEPNYDKL